MIPVNTNPVLMLVVAVLAIAVICLIARLLKETNRARINREQALTPRDSNPEGDDSSIQGDARDSRTMSLARMVNEVLCGGECPDCAVMREKLNEHAALFYHFKRYQEAGECLAAADRRVRV